MIITEIAQYLHDNGLGIYSPNGVDGNIFLEFMPDEPDEAICLHSTGGMAADVATPITRPTVQVIVRGNTDSLAVAAIAESIHDALNNLHSMRFTMDGEYILLCQCRQSEPTHVGVDENGRHEYSINLALITGGN